MLKESWGKIQWALMTVGAASLILPLLGLGLEGMRRRVASYAATPQLQPLHVVTAVGGFLVFLGVALMIANIVTSLKRGQAAGPNPWSARTLEWQTPSPPPEENFEEIPQVVQPPYGYGDGT
jgi:cytochrome c oxidase subunit 1